jgi:hypothetical protein
MYRTVLVQSVRPLHPLLYTVAAQVVLFQFLALLLLLLLLPSKRSCSVQPWRQFVSPYSRFKGGQAWNVDAPV